MKTAFYSFTRGASRTHGGRDFLITVQGNIKNSIGNFNVSIGSYWEIEKSSTGNYLIFMTYRDMQEALRNLGRLHLKTAGIKPISNYFTAGYQEFYR